VLGLVRGRVRVETSGESPGIMDRRRRLVQDPRTGIKRCDQRFFSVKVCSKTNRNMTGEGTRSKCDWWKGAGAELVGDIGAAYDADDKCVFCAPTKRSLGGGGSSSSIAYADGAAAAATDADYGTPGSSDDDGNCNVSSSTTRLIISGCKENKWAGLEFDGASDVFWWFSFAAELFDGHGSEFGFERGITGRVVRFQLLFRFGWEQRERSSRRGFSKWWGRGGYDCWWCQC
jgi:hypothetical protein